MPIKVFATESAPGVVPFSVSGYSDLEANYTKTRSVTDPENVWYDSGLSINIPSDGKYMVGYVATCSVGATAAFIDDSGLIVSLYDTTNASRIARSYSTAVFHEKTAETTDTISQTVRSEVLLDVLESDIFRLDMLYGSNQDGTVYTINTQDIPAAVAGTYLYYHKVG